MKKILISLLMMFMLVPCINAEEVENVNVNENEVVQTTNEIVENEAKETILDKYLNNVAPNNVVTMMAIQSLVKNYKYLNNPTNVYDDTYNPDTCFSLTAHAYIKNVESIDGCYATIENISEDLSHATLKVNYSRVGEESISDAREVILKWAEENPEKSQTIKEYASKISMDKIRYMQEDMGLIEYVVNNPNWLDYPDLELNLFKTNVYKNYAISNDEFDYSFIEQSGGGMPFTEGQSFLLNISFDGVSYISVGIGSHGRNYYIYIPNDTENTPEAYIKAAKTRIDEYFGTNDIKIEKAGTITEYLGEDMDEYWSSIFGDYTINNTGDYYYSVTIGENVLDFVIIKDSNKIGNTIKETTDVKTGATISTTSNEVPMDATINVQIIEQTSEVFKNIVEKIKAKVNEVMVLDFKLFSKSKNDYITKLSNGEFIVSVPIIDALKGKDLIAYYITDEGKIEKHPVTVKDGVATFTTNHFSIYTIAEDNSIKVPNTYDGIMNFVIMGIIGIVGLGVFFTLKTRKN